MGVLFPSYTSVEWFPVSAFEAYDDASNWGS